MSRKKGFTLIELLVVVAIIAVLISMLLPALGAARNSATNLRCATNVRQIHMATFSYANDYNGRLPVFEANQPWVGAWSYYDPGVWYLVRAILPYVNLPQDVLNPGTSSSNKAELFHCPTDLFDGLGFEGPWHGASYDFNWQYQGNSIDANPVASIIEKVWSGWSWIYREVTPDKAPLWWDFTQQNITRHVGGVNVGYYDGHVVFERRSNWIPYKFAH